MDEPSPNILGSTFLGTGNDEAGVRYTSSAVKMKGGYYIKDDYMALQADVVNYNSGPRNVYVTFDIEYFPGKTGPDAASTLLTLTGCGLPPGFIDPSPVSNLTSDFFLVFEDGAIINASKCFLQFRT